MLRYTGFVCMTANEVRGDYQFVHTFGTDPKYKVNPGSVVLFLSERFQTKYEPKWQVLEIQVCTCWCVFCNCMVVYII